MKTTGFALLGWLAVLFGATFASAAPVIAGLANKHGLTEAETGQLLLGELRCAACHADKGAAVLADRLAPDLTNIAARVAPDYLQRFVASPSAAHAGSTMPDLLAGKPVPEREQIANELTHFLISQSPGKFSPEPLVAGVDAIAGKTLFHSVGCVSCHAPRDDDGKELAREGAIELGHVPGKHSPGSLASFLFEPLKVRPAGRMPDMKLTRIEASQISAYLLGKQPKPAKSLEADPALAAAGKLRFAELNCAACHKLGDIPAKPAGKELRVANLAKGCLDGASKTTPRFNLSEPQTKAIRSALATPGMPASDKTKMAMTLATFNCIACHQRDETGGVPAEHNMLFRSTEKELGDEARIPPPLTLVGAKLQPVALKKMLFDGDTVRPYMLTRMPQFGEPNLRHLPELFQRLDTYRKFVFNLPKTETDDRKEQTRERAMRAGGRELVGDKGLYCVACHTFNGKSPSNKGIDLLTFPERLQPAWFHDYMINPGRFRPRTVMPTAWPGGLAMQKTILDGDTDRQIEAIWFYLTLGTSAQDPSGVRTIETALPVTDAARTYRGRSSVSGYRGIAVGFPEKINYAFNAETGTLSAIWKGEFVRVNRGGQGSGDFNPAGPAIRLAQDVSFFLLPDEQTAWPLKPVMTKEAPVNPDPLYPKNRGYQFKGYQLDEKSVPTFSYRGAEIEIEDRSAPEAGAKTPRLVRRLTFESSRDQKVWFRALTGAIVEDGKQQFKTPELRVTLPSGRTLLRPNSGDPKGSELLLQLDIPKGKTTYSVTYEILK